MDDFNILYIINVVNSLLTIVLLAFVYTYLTNLEAIGCECSLSPNASFIKGFTIFAIIYLIVTKFIPDSMIRNNFGDSLLIVKTFVDIIFFIVFAYYLYTVFQYTRFLVNEKCKCSADTRREIIMIGSLIEFALIFILFLFHFIIAVGMSVIFAVIREINESGDNIRNVVRDPIGSITKVPSTIKKDINEISSYVSKTKKELASLGKKGTKKISSRK
jgi:predicted PurR-regulated permease PerM